LGHKVNREFKARKATKGRKAFRARILRSPVLPVRKAIKARKVMTDKTVRASRLMGPCRQRLIFPFSPRRMQVKVGSPKMMGTFMFGAARHGLMLAT
jgi:hypothetical protein